jgi:hypothetical protein
VSCKWTKGAAGDCVNISKYSQRQLEIFDILYLGWIFPKMCNKFLATRSSEDVPVILAGDINVNVNDNYKTELVQFMKGTIEYDVLSDLSQRTTTCNSWIDMVFTQNVDNLSCTSTFPTLAIIRVDLS